MAEHPTVNRTVAGSSPAAGALLEGPTYEVGPSFVVRARVRVIGGVSGFISVNELRRDGTNMTSPLRSWEDAAMAYRDIRIIGDPVLRTECDWITDIDDSVRALVEDLLETVDEDGRAGLAANQIGVGLRAFSWNIDGEIGYILNPKIVELSKDEYQDGDEGCLSVPGLWFPTERAWYARAQGTDLDGKEVVIEGEELMARCIQHECDHLEGHLYLDRLDRKNRAKAMKELRAQGL